MKRSECVNGPRPCCYFSCKYNLSIDRYGSVNELERRVNDNLFRSSDFEYGTNCLLDITDKFPEGLSNIEIAKVLGTNKESVRLDVLEALTQYKMFFSECTDNTTESLSDWKERLEDVLDEHYSPHREDVEYILERYPRLTYAMLCNVADSFDWKQRLGLSDSEWDVIVDPLSYNTEVVSRYDLYSIPFTYDAAVLGKKVGFSEDMIEVWIAKGLEFLVGRNGETLIERASLLDFLESHGKYHYKVLNNSDHKKRISDDSLQELRINLIKELDYNA